MPALNPAFSTAATAADLLSPTTVGHGVLLPLIVHQSATATAATMASKHDDEDEGHLDFLRRGGGAWSRTDVCMPVSAPTCRPCRRS